MDLFDVKVTIQTRQSNSTVIDDNKGKNTLRTLQNYTYSELQQMTFKQLEGGN